MIYSHLQNRHDVFTCTLEHSEFVSLTRLLDDILSTTIHTNQCFDKHYKKSALCWQVLSYESTSCFLHKATISSLEPKKKKKKKSPPTTTNWHLNNSHLSVKKKTTKKPLNSKIQNQKSYLKLPVSVFAICFPSYWLKAMTKWFLKAIQRLVKQEEQLLKRSLFTILTGLPHRHRLCIINHTDIWFASCSFATVALCNFATEWLHKF